MGLLSSSKGSERTSLSASLGTAALNGAQISLTLLKEAMDGTNIPFVKGVAGVAVEAIKMAKSIQSNREECDDLIKRATSILVVILGSFRGETEDAIPVHLKNGVERLTASFHEILADLRIIERRVGKWSVGGLARAILSNIDNGEKLKDCSAKLEWAMGEFQVTSKVDSCLKDLERHERLKKGQEGVKEEVREGQVKMEVMEVNIKAGQGEIRDGLTEIRDVINEQRITKSSFTDNLPSTVMPAEPKIFGRQEYIEKAVTLLRSGVTARLVILGPGGMGKTSVALKIIYDGRVKQLYGEYRCWVPCEQATSILLFIELLAKSLHLPPSSSSDRFNEVIIFLENSQTVYLLLLDNFETPWDIEGQQSYVVDILTKLASIPTVSLLITMRGGQYPASDTIEWSTPRLPSLTQLALEPAEQAFLRISPEAAGDPELKTLLQALDCMPLAITLMAKLSEVGESIPDLLSQWSTERTRLLDTPGGDRRNSIEVSIKLSLQSRAVKSNPDAIRLLSVLSMLPAGAALTRLPDMCPSLPTWKTALRVLQGAALVYDSADKSRVQVLSPIQSYILLHHPLQQDLLDELRSAYYQLAPRDQSALGHPEFNDAWEELAKEEVNIEAVLINALHDVNANREAIGVAIFYSIFLHWKKPRTDVIVEAVRVAREIHSSQLAHCLGWYAHILRMQGRDDLAEPIYEQAEEEYSLIGDENSVAEVRRRLGSILSFRGEFDRAHTLIQDARDVLLQRGDIIAAAMCLWDIGQSFYSQQEWSSARSALEQARSEFITVGSRPGATKCLVTLGATLGRQGDYDAGQSALEEARLAWLEMGDPNGVASCLLYQGDTYERAGDYARALAKYEDAVTIFTELGDVDRTNACKRGIDRVWAN